MKVFTMLLLLCPLLLMAQQYSLDELMDQGLKNSFSVQKSELSTKAAETSLSSAKWNLAPDLNVNAGVDKDLAPLTGAEDLSSYAGISLSKTISLNDPSYFGYKKAVVNSQTAELNLKQSKQSYAYQVISAYLDVLSAERQRSSLNENLNIQNRVWEQSKVLLQLGKTTNFDVKQNEIAVMNSQIALMELENTIANARTKLFGLVQVPDGGYPLSDVALDLQQAVPACNPDNSNDIRLLQFEQQSNALEMKQGKLDNYPRLSMDYSLARKVSGGDFDFDRYNTTHTLGLSLSYPLLNYFKNGNNVTQLKINDQLTQLSIREKQDQIKRDYDNNVNELNYLLRLQELLQQKLAQSQEQIKQAEERYRLGMIDILELDKTRTEYIDADISYNTNGYKIIAKQEAINYLLSQPLMGKW